MAWGDIATWVGIVVAACIGGWGIRQSSKANTTSDRAVQLATLAEERAARLEAIQLEGRDIEWAHEWVPAGNTISIRNIGTSRAYEVVLTVDVTGTPRQTIGPRLIEAGRDITYTLDMPTQERVLLEALVEGRESLVEASLRLTWRTAAGTPGVATWPELRLGSD